MTDVQRKFRDAPKSSTVHDVPLGLLGVGVKQVLGEMARLQRTVSAISLPIPCPNIS